MNARMSILALALLALVAVPVVGQEADTESGTQTSAQTSQAQADDPDAINVDDVVDEEWLNTIWTQVDDLVKVEEHKLQETVTVAGVRGAEAEDAILDKLYYKGGKRYPSQDKLTKAIETLKKALAKDPKSAAAPKQKYFVAQCYEKLGQTAEAKNYYGLVAKDHPKSPLATKAQERLTQMTAATTK